ncbi:hypothetical protein RHGRI_015138 [Rhododendron griersonianum]|uniref:SWIM-type domain-containing protein n=1 Tax=Rhododendron griersonianum TaxID=479676 RepID=A0AAV6KCN2_9ERIC|nr:hypothetical protein RHGRI_015138 [Rhododendron griersonianum]
MDSDEDGSLGDQSEHSDEDFINDSDQSEHSDEDYSFSSANEDSGSSTDGFSSYESDNEDGRDSSDEEGKKGKTYVDITKFGQEFHVDGEEGKVILKENLLFENVDKFREVLKEYTIQKGCKIVKVKNEKSRVTCHCAALGCPWRIHASPLPDSTTYKIRTYHGEHTCISSTKISEATSKWICKKMLRCLRANPKMTLESMQVEVQHKYGIEASLTQLYRARRKALADIEGNHAKSYSLLPAYAYEVLKSNPGSLVKIKGEMLTPTSTPMFQRFFIAFDAMITGFKSGCRPFIGLDGCHLKGPYGGILLAAVGLDGNNGLFPIVVAIVEMEGSESWTFFIDHLQTVLGHGSEAKPWTFMSDMQKHSGLLLRKCFWEAARAYNQIDFNQAMERMKDISEEAHKWLSDVPTHKWARHAFDDRVKNDHITNNLTESFNSWLGQLRHKPVLSLLEGIRTKVMSRIQKRYAKGMTWTGSVGSHVKKRLAKAQNASRICTLLYCGGDVYEVIDDGHTFQLNMSTRTCTCREWQVAGIPCRHTVSALTHKRVNIEDGCDPSYKLEAYMQCYGGMIHPIRDQRYWEPDQFHKLDPPPLRRMPGRPRKNRRREADEAPAGASHMKRSQTLRCTNCKEFGHNRRTCQRAPVKKKKGANSQVLLMCSIFCKIMCSTSCNHVLSAVIIMCKINLRDKGIKPHKVKHLKVKFHPSVLHNLNLQL